MGSNTTGPLFVCSTAEARDQFWLSDMIGFRKATVAIPQEFNAFNDTSLLYFTLEKHDSPTYYRDAALAADERTDEFEFIAPATPNSIRKPPFSRRCLRSATMAQIEAYNASVKDSLRHRAQAARRLSLKSEPMNMQIHVASVPGDDSDGELDSKTEEIFDRVNSLPSSPSSPSSSSSSSSTFSPPSSIRTRSSSVQIPPRPKRGYVISQISSHNARGLVIYLSRQKNCLWSTPRRNPVRQRRTLRRSVRNAEASRNQSIS